MNAVTRKEKILEAIASSGTIDFVPTTREELFLAHILDSSIQVPTPIKRLEKLYKMVADGDELDFVPTLRLELFVAKAAGMDVPFTLIPITQEELYWSAIEGGGGGTVTTVTGVSPLALVNALAKPIESLVQYGKCVQSGTPTPDAPVDIVCNNGAVKYGATGKNAFNADITSGKSITGQGQFVNTSSRSATVNGVSIIGGEEYILSYAETFRNGVFFYDANDEFISYLAWGNPPRTFTAPSNARFVRFSFYDATPPTNVQLELGSTATDYEPYVGGIITDGTPEVLSVGGVNLFNPATVPDEFAYVNKATGKILKNADFRHSDFIAITGDVDYYFGVVGYSASTAGLAWYSDANEDAYISGVSGTTLSNEGKVATAPANAKYVRFSWQIDEAHNADWEQSVYLCVNGTLDAWEPYRTPQTATVPDLYAVGDYKDEIDLISGVVTRRVGIKILTGEEDWRRTGGVAWYAEIEGMKKCNPVMDGYSTHFIGTHAATASMPDGSIKNTYATGGAISIRLNSAETVADFKAFLAEQYAAGTPVIVFYPLAEEITESVTPQPLRTAEGDNTISVTSNVDSVQLTAKYLVSS